MERQDDLWPPWGPGFGRNGSGGRSHRDRQAEHVHEKLREQRERGRGRRMPTLTRDEIVDAAIAIADAEGAEAVSMRRIAQVLRAGAMSLYWHVASKDHLLGLMQDTLMAEVGVPEPAGDWRAYLQAHARSSRAVLLRHRWVIDFLAAGPALGPNTLRIVDRNLAALADLDIDTATAMNVLQTVQTYVSGAVMREFQELRVQREQEKMDVSGPEFAAGLTAWRQRLAATGQFDHFLRLFSDDVDPDAEDTRNERFEFGLDCVLDGIAVKLAKLSGPAAPESSGRPAPARWELAGMPPTVPPITLPPARTATPRTPSTSRPRRSEGPTSRETPR